MLWAETDLAAALSEVREFLESPYELTVDLAKAVKDSEFYNENAEQCMQLRAGMVSLDGAVSTNCFLLKELDACIENPTADLESALTPLVGLAMDTSRIALALGKNIFSVMYEEDVLQRVKMVATTTLKRSEDGSPGGNSTCLSFVESLLSESGTVFPSDAEIPLLRSNVEAANAAQLASETLVGFKQKLLDIGDPATITIDALHDVMSIYQKIRGCVGCVDTLYEECVKAHKSLVLLVGE